MDKLIISGPLPPSTNKLYKNLPASEATLYRGGLKQGGRFPGRALTKEAKTFKKNLVDSLFAMQAGRLCPLSPFTVHLHFRFPDKRRRDLSNQIKLLEDTVMNFLGYDDTLVYDMHLWKYIDRKCPGFVMEIRHCDRDIEV